MKIPVKRMGTSLIAICAVMSASLSQAQGKGTYELFSTKVPAGAEWEQTNKIIREGGYNPDKSNYIYVGCGSKGHEAHLTGLDIKIRQNPSAGQFRYLSFAWIKWAGSQIGIKFDVVPKKGAKGEKYDYTYYAGIPGENSQNPINKGLKLDDKVPGNWTVMSRDIWKDFGDCDITGVTFICPERRDAGFDELIFAQTEALLANAPKILPDKVATPQAVTEDEDAYLLEEWSEFEDPDASAVTDDGVKINWEEQIKAGGFMMYPLYALGFIALLIAIQRLIVSRRGNFAPKKLQRELKQYIKDGDMEKAVDACYKRPSILARSAKYILLHRDAPREAVAETAGDMAARDIRSQLDKIYPISVISSLSPLIGLLGTVVGMIEAFGLVAMYGDEGGASILSDSISKALITTAAGLVIAVPAICLYYILKNRIMGLSSKVESSIEDIITMIYLEKKPPQKDTADKCPAMEEIKIENPQIVAEINED